jgi:uncharacterized protein (TIGR00375 family)
MRFHADLHIHSKYSRATSRDLDLEHLALWAARKGVTVVGTGDFTHPAWRAELKEKLLPAEPGLFRLRPEIERELAAQLPAACQTPARFMLEVEISTIYKKGERVRKVHHLIYAPDFHTADRFSLALGRIGNISSDGRPILGLDSRHLLEIALTSGPDAYLIPAHIWTPWFAVLGSQSGFDTITECYGDLADRIFAVETGLSSDPPMNWRLSMLDRYRLVSNSDAHSPGKLGREATTFDTEVDYFAIKRALETGDGYVGTVEFFPEEGKYHHDGHRKCGVRLTPAETEAQGSTRCPVCGQPMTIGVLSRADALADRPEGHAPPATAGDVSNLVPLCEVLGELASTGPASKKVERLYDRLVTSLGSELAILGEIPVEDIARAESSLLAEAITRLRAGTVIREAGYDGEYGVIRLFEDHELKRLAAGGVMLFDPGAGTPARKKKAAVSKDAPVRGAATAGAGAAGAAAGMATTAPGSASEASAAGRADAPAAAERGVGSRATTSPRAHAAAAGSLLSVSEDTPPVADERARDGSPRTTSGGEAPRPQAGSRRAGGDLLSGLDSDQRRAAETIDGPLLIVAGPGSGKTRTLTHRLAHLVAERGAPPASCLAITFTRRAAAEMRERLERLLPGLAGEPAHDAVAGAGAAAGAVAIHTFHSLGLDILREHAATAGLGDDFRIATDAERLAALTDALGVSERKAQTLLRAISKAKRTQAPPADADIANALDAYQRALAALGAIDFDDLIGLPLRLLETHPDIAASYQARFHWISVDEFQDVDDQQYRLLAHLTGAAANLCAIGDPNQAIYGFRGADASCFDRFKRDFPGAATIPLSRNYRSTGTIVTASSQVITVNQPAQAQSDRAQPDQARTDQVLLRIVREMHEHITLHSAPTERAEAEFVVQTIEGLLGGHSFFSIDSGRAIDRSQSALGFADFAVLFRTDAQSAALVEAFARSGIPFKKHAHEPLADQSTAKALLQALDLAGPRPADDAKAARPAPAGSLDTPVARTADRTTDRASTDAPVPSHALTAQLLNAAAQLDLPQGDPTLQRLTMLADACQGDRARFADAVALATEADFWDPRADRVSLLTIHAAKGLEFPIVFIVGLEDGVLPLYWDELDEATTAEERRLCYVGMTRAKDRLFLSRAAQRLWRGKVREMVPSPFLGDIEQELVKHQKTRAVRKKPDDPQLRLL